METTGRDSRSLIHMTGVTRQRTRKASIAMLILRTIRLTLSTQPDCAHSLQLFAALWMANILVNRPCTGVTMILTQIITLVGINLTGQLDVGANGRIRCSQNNPITAPTARSLSI